MIAAFVARKPSFLTSDEWLNLPFQETAKTSRDELVEILLTYPSLLKQADFVRNCEDRTAAFDLCAHLETECYSMDDALEDWHAKILTEKPKCIDLEDRLASDFPAENNPSILGNHEALDAHTVMLYWTARLVLGGVAELIFILQQRFEPCTASSRLVALVERDQYAINIAHSIGHFLQPRMGTYAAQMTLFPMGVALNHFTLTDKEEHPAMRGLVGMFDKMEAVGLPFRSFLKSIRPPIKVDSEGRKAFMDW